MGGYGCRTTSFASGRPLLLLTAKQSEKDKIAERRAKIKDLLAQGLKQKDICSQLDISKPTYVRDRNFLKEQGLI